MNRLELGKSTLAAPFARPDMTVLEAAEALEHDHATRLLVRDAEEIVGVLTEDDIVQKVLNAGLRPDVVRVSDIMHSGHRSRDGSGLLFESEPVTRMFLHERRPSFPVLRGLCEDCGDASDVLDEHGGRVLCGDCAIPSTRRNTV